MLGLVQDAALAALSTAIVQRWLTLLRRDRCVIVMMHRFAGSGGVSHGHQPHVLRETLAAFRASGVRLVDLHDAIATYADPTRVESGRPPAVAFTVDDGYSDFLSVGVPIFAEFDCPVTCFVVPDVIDGKSWFWWDQLDWLLARVPAEGATVELDGVPVELRQVTMTAGRDWRDALAERMKRTGESGRLRFLDDIAASIGQSCPALAPDGYRVLDWETIRSAERRGVTFGAHSLRHPILSQCNDDRAREEIVGSAKRLRAELSNPSRVFCYPYGREGEFLTTHGRFVEEADLDYAVCAVAGRLSGRFPAETGADWKWRIPRLAFEDRRGVVARHLLL